MLRCAASSSSTTSNRLTGRSMNSCSLVSASLSDSLVAGLVRKSMAPGRRDVARAGGGHRFDGLAGGAGVGHALGVDAVHRLARLHGVHERQVQREGAAFARGAVDPDLAAKEPGDLAADREAQAGTAELSAGAGVALLERLEDDAVLLPRDADAAVADA